MKEWLEDRAKRKEMDFRIQFRDSIQSVSAALKAGYSVENAIRETRKDLSPMYGEEARIMKEYTLMIYKLDMNRTAGQVLGEFADRVRQEDVTDFVNVFTAARQSGGDSIALIRNAVKIIGEKIDTEREIRTMLAAKKLEFEIMCAVPFFIILYMKMTFGDFLSMLYGNLPGAAVMSGCLAVYLAAYMYGRRLMQIEV
ncbi:type II secretion system F family protein [Lachnoclostridium sp. An169]|uniref:type II secretion system F family protein n=1 Tax=Lachnoclostridium sp. An169 TaxID=1965569 RepID=UPI000B392EE3|nr:type II secretion system F family protein [Lachnoclostridium sp. An169]HJA65668.1 type II secretion system F family protein [Candidatus Mediterraneibacter cottocaccae]